MQLTTGSRYLFCGCASPAGQHLIPRSQRQPSRHGVPTLACLPTWLLGMAMITASKASIRLSTSHTRRAPHRTEQLLGMCSLRLKVSSSEMVLLDPSSQSPMQSLMCPASPGFKLHKYPCRSSCHWTLPRNATRTSHRQLSCRPGVCHTRPPTFELVSRMSVPACDCFFREGGAKNRVPLLPSPRPARNLPKLCDRNRPMSAETTGLREWIIGRKTPLMFRIHRLREWPAESVESYTSAHLEPTSKCYKKGSRSKFFSKIFLLRAARVGSLGVLSP